MTKDLLETLYSKKAKDFSKSDVKYIYKLLHNKFKTFQTRFCLFGIPLISFGFGPLLTALLGVPINIGLFVGLGVGVTTGPIFALIEHIDRYSLKELGLTKQEWKELKKSGRLKELERMVKEYENTDYSKLGDLEEESKYIESQLINNEKERQTLIERQQANRDRTLALQAKMQSTQNNTNDSSLGK